MTRRCRSVRAFKLGGMVKYYTPMFVSSISFGLVMNPKSYSNLPADLRPLVDELASRESTIRMSTWSWGEDFPRFLSYMKEANLTNVELSAAADKAMHDRAEAVMGERIAELEKKGLPARAAYAKLKELSAKYAAE